MKVLVMGGTRLMGRETVLRLVARRHDVTVFNRGTRAGTLPAEVRELHGDRDTDAVAALGGLALDAVVDFSAYTSAQTARLLDVLGGVRRWVHASTGAVYAPDPALPWHETRTPTGPWPLWGDYAREKLRCETLLAERRPGDASTVALRIPMVLGPGNYVPREELVLNRLLDGEPVLVPGDGQAVQHFVAARQVGEAAALAVERIEEPGFRALNVAEPRALASLRGFVELCARVAGVEADVRAVPDDGPPVFDLLDNVFPFPNRPYVVDLEAARAAGILPAPLTLEEMLREALDHLLAHPQRRAWRRTPAELRALEALA